MEPNALVMVGDSDDIWCPGRIMSGTSTHYSIQTDHKGLLTVARSSVVPISDKSLLSVDDMTQLDELHESLILHNLRQRYKDNIIYTYIGPMIISVNPYRIIPEYGEHLIPQYQNQKEKEELQPHLYTIAQSAYKSLLDFGDSQSIIISGESGAGKTEATKIILRYLAATCRSKANQQDLSGMILATNPILESFGNAKTTRNNNSSRFGKFIKVMFEDSLIVGAQIDNYLLEKTRIVYQAPTERNYHIFYQFINGSTPEEKTKYKLKPSCKEYTYLTNGDVEVEGINDSNWWQKTLKAFDTLKFSLDEIDQILSVLSAILILGNINFQGKDKVSFKAETEVTVFCELLKVDKEKVKKALLMRRLQVGNENIQVPLNSDQAIENRDALAKDLYSRLFNWLVKRLNKQLKGDSAAEGVFIGVLDIYGFEIFDQNSLEQFCINYANEKLHQQFNHHVFKTEQEEYIKEGVAWSEINFKDNQACLNLIEHRQRGVVGFLLEECKLPKGSDKGFQEKLVKQFAKNMYFDYSPQIPDIFGIKHFAGLVKYNVNGWRDKNKDTLNDDAIISMKSSTIPLIQDVFAEEAVMLDNLNPAPADPAPATLAPPEEPKGYTPRLSALKSNPFMNKAVPALAKSGTNSLSGLASPRLSGVRSNSISRPGDGISTPRESDTRKTVTIKFQDDLTKLVDTLASSNRHYVRCVKPNNQKVPSTFTSEVVMSQLAGNGVFETVRLRKAGFANRLPLDRFINKYYICLGNNERSKEGVATWLSEFLNDAHEWTMGSTKVFLRETAIDKISYLQVKLMENHTIKTQSYIRTWNAMINYHRLRAAVRLQSYIKTFNAINEFVRLRAAVKMQSFIRLHITRVFYQKLLAVVKMQSFMRRYWAIDKLDDLREKNNAAIVIQRFTYMFNSIGIYNYLWDRNQASLKIQRYIRSKFAVDILNHLRTLNNTAIVTQRFIRRLFAQRVLDRLILEHNSAIRMQNIVRRYNSRLVLDRLILEHNSAIKMQNWIRHYNSKLVLEELYRMDKASRKMQNIIRQYNARLVLDRLILEHNSAIRMQNIVRRYNSRLVLDRLILEHNSAIRMQNIVRHYNSKLVLEELYRMDKSARKMQNIVRRYNSRLILDRLILEHNSAIKMQNIVRQFNSKLVLEELYRMDKASRKMQNIIRQYNAGLVLGHLYRLDKSALICQNYIRKLLANAKLDHLRLENKSATTLQRFIRVDTERRKLDHLRKLFNSSIIFQSFIRRYISLNIFKELQIQNELRIADEKRKEEERLAKEAEDKRLAKEAEDKRLAKEAEDKRLAKEAEDKRLAKEAEDKRLAKEAEDKRLAKEAEDKRIAKEAEDKRLAKEAEDKRLAKEAEDKRLAKEAEDKRLAKEAEDKRLAKEAEDKRLAKEAEDKRLAKEAEDKRLAKEAEDKRKEQDRLAKEAEDKRVAKEAEDKRLAKEAEDKRLAKEAEDKRLAKEAEDKRLAKEVEDKRKEQDRLAKEAEDKRVAKETEDKRKEQDRLTKEAEDKRLVKEAEDKRLAKEAEDKRLAKEAEDKRLAKEVEDKRKEQDRLAKEAEEKRVAKETEDKRKEQDRLAKEAETEQKRLDKEAEDKRKAEAEVKRLAKETEDKRKEQDRLAKEAEEKRVAKETEDKRKEQDRLAEDKRKAEQDRIAQDLLKKENDTRLEQIRLQEERMKLEEEKRQIEKARRVLEENLKMAQQLEKEKLKIEQEKKQLQEEKRKLDLMEQQKSRIIAEEKRKLEIEKLKFQEILNQPKPELSIEDLEADLDSKADRFSGIDDLTADMEKDTSYSERSLPRDHVQPTPEVTMPLSTRKSVRNDKIFEALLSKGKDNNEPLVMSARQAGKPPATNLMQSLPQGRNTPRTQGARIAPTSESAPDNNIINRQRHNSVTPLPNRLLFNPLVEAVKNESSSGLTRRRSIIYSNPEHSLRSGDYATDSAIPSAASSSSTTEAPSDKETTPTTKRNNVAFIRSLSSIDSRVFSNVDPSTIQAYHDKIESDRLRTQMNPEPVSRNTSENREGASTVRTRRYSSFRAPPSSKDDTSIGGSLGGSSIVSPRDEIATRKIRMSSVSAPRPKETDSPSALSTRRPSTSRANYNPVGSNLFKSTYTSLNQRNKK